MTSYIYFIQVDGGGPIKIGITRHNPRQRMVKIQSDCPWPVKLLGTINGSLEQEAELHCRLNDFNIQGEWFQPSAEVISVIELLLQSEASIQFPKRKTGPKYDHPLCKYRNENGLTLRQVAAQVGDIEFASLSRIESGRQKPSIDLAIRIAKATGIHIREMRPDIYRLFYPEGRVSQ